MCLLINIVLMCQDDKTQIRNLTGISELIKDSFLCRPAKLLFQEEELARSTMDSVSTTLNV